MYKLKKSDFYSNITFVIKNSLPKHQIKSEIFKVIIGEANISLSQIYAQRLKNRNVVDVNIEILSKKHIVIGSLKFNVKFINGKKIQSDLY